MSTTLKPIKPIVTKNIKHYFMYGRTACGYGDGKRPAYWTAGHLWCINWVEVTCKACRKKMLIGTTKEQYEVLRHTLGLKPRDGVRVKPPRNKFVDEPYAVVPNQLVRKGMMVKGGLVETFGGMCVYQATNFGTDVARKPFVEETCES